MRRDNSFVRHLLKDTDFVAVDIGARGDIPANWLPLDGVARFLSIDADPAACDALKGVYDSRGHGHRYNVVPAALTKTGGRRTLYKTNSRSGSSLFRPDTQVMTDYTDADYLFPIESTSIDTKSPRDVFAEARVDNPAMMKLDIQGCELEVLEGMGRDLLNAVMCIEMEASMQTKGPGYPTFCEINHFMLDNRFELFDIRPVRIHRARNGRRAAYLEEIFGVRTGSPSVSPRIWEVDAVYFRDPREVLRRGDRLAVRTLAASFCVYGFFSEAHFVVSEAREANILASGEAETALGAIVAWHRQTRYRWRYGLGRLPAVARWLIKKADLQEGSNW